MEDNIFLFIPNLIGYSRIVLALVSFYYMPYDPVKATVFYLLSGLLDAFDTRLQCRHGKYIMLAIVLGKSNEYCTEIMS